MYVSSMCVRSEKDDVFQMRTRARIAHVTFSLCVYKSDIFPYIFKLKVGSFKFSAPRLGAEPGSHCIRLGVSFAWSGLPDN